MRDDQPTSATLEFSVDMTCSNCEKKVATALEKGGITDYQIDLGSQKVVVKTDKPSEAVKNVVETTGKLAVLVGSGNMGAAVAMVGREGDYFSQGPKGVVRLTQIDAERCVIEGTVDGLTPGEHGLAIHETGDTSRGCASLGDHYNPRGTRHGSPDNGQEDRHVGDLGNVLAGPDGRARFRLVDPLVKVWDVIGRSVVVASGADDLGLGVSVASLATGDCGEGAACGVIARSAGLGQNVKKICACDGVTIWDERNKPLAGEGRRS
eukprot:GFUD01028905.1.p1 GENE.GFUD01028905.1~~GFUD01028905.1.p1  ORF type:complete len:265 (+),score=100.90 GFUD01028905.1:82-876(+)